MTLPEGTNKIGRPPTYSIYNAWSKQTSTQYALPNNAGDEELGTLPSGQRRDAGAGVHRINIPSSPFHNLYFPPNAYRRRFIKDELVRVPFKMEGDKRVPIVGGPDGDEDDRDNPGDLYSDEESDNPPDSPPARNTRAAKNRAKNSAPAQNTRGAKKRAKKKRGVDIRDVGNEEEEAGIRASTMPPPTSQSPGRRWFISLRYGHRLCTYGCLQCNYSNERFTYALLLTRARSPVHGPFLQRRSVNDFVNQSLSSSPVRPRTRRRPPRTSPTHSVSEGQALSF